LRFGGQECATTGRLAMSLGCWCCAYEVFNVKLHVCSQIWLDLYSLNTLYNYYNYKHTYIYTGYFNLS